MLHELAEQFHESLLKKNKVKHFQTDFRRKGKKSRTIIKTKFLLDDSFYDNTGWLYLGLDLESDYTFNKMIESFGLQDYTKETQVEICEGIKSMQFIYGGWTAEVVSYEDFLEQHFAKWK